MRAGHMGLSPDRGREVKRPCRTCASRRALLAGGGRGVHICDMSERLTVTLNGEPRELPGPVTVAGLLAMIGLDARKVAVERNEEIVPRSAYAATRIAAGDALEIVHFIGGG
jgi:sulfur carrier protein